MNKIKYYFCDIHEESCWQLEHYADMMNEENFDEIILTEAVMVTGQGFYFCSEFGEIGESGDGNCGVICDSYKPRNGKNGRCVHSNNTYEHGKRKFKLTIEHDIKKKKRKLVMTEILPIDGTK